MDPLGGGSGGGGCGIHGSGDFFSGGGDGGGSRSTGGAFTHLQEPFLPLVGNSNLHIGHDILILRDNN